MTSQVPLRVLQEEDVNSGPACRLGLELTLCAEQEAAGLGSPGAPQLGQGKHKANCCWSNALKSLEYLRPKAICSHRHLPEAPQSAGQCPPQSGSGKLPGPPLGDRAPQDPLTGQPWLLPQRLGEEEAGRRTGRGPGADTRPAQGHAHSPVAS